MQNLFLCVLQVQCILLERTFPTGVVNVRIYNNIFRIGNSRDFSLITVCASGIKYLELNIFSNKVVPLKVRKNWVCLVGLLPYCIGSKWSLWHVSPSHFTMSRLLVMDFCGLIKKHMRGGGCWLCLNYV